MPQTQKLFIDEKLKALAKLFYPVPLYVTGGYVRNSLLSCTLSDIDICSALTAKEAAAVIDGSPYRVTAEYNKLGTLKIACGKDSYEYTAFRKDIYAEGGGHTPERVEFCTNIVDDAKRRDFTVNAVYYDICGEVFADPLNGIQDIKNRIIRAYEPEAVFRSDGLRLLRMVRFACELNFEIDKKTLDAAKSYASLLKDIKSERIFEEFYKILLSDCKYPEIENEYPQYRGIKLLKELNLLPVIIPQIELSYNVKQRTDFHRYDVFEHTAQTLKYSDKSIRLAAVLHDIGKGICFKENGNFHGHENVGSQVAGQIMGRQGLKCPQKLIDETAFLIKHHMYDLNCITSENKIKLLIVKNYKYIEKLLLLKQADYLGCGLQSGTAPTVLRWQKIIAEMKRQKTPFSLKELAVNGADIRECGCPDKYIGKVLNRLFIDCIYNPRLNERETLRQKAIRYINGYIKEF